MALVEYLVKDRIGFITLNRPEKRNALSPEMIAELKEVLSTAESAQAVKVIVLRANGDAFCAGADLAYLQQLQGFSHDENLADSQQLKELFLRMYRLKKVIIAQVQGPALAGGCGLTTVCDFVIAVPDATFGYTEVRIGFIPALVMIFLIRKIGEARAKELLLTGNLIRSAEAQSFGMITKVVDANRLSLEVDEFANRLITGASAHSLTVTKNMIADVQNLSLEEALDFAARQNAQVRASLDCKKGIDAFLKKQPITW